MLRPCWIASRRDERQAAIDSGLNAPCSVRVVNIGEHRSLCGVRALGEASERNPASQSSREARRRSDRGLRYFARQVLRRAAT